MVITQHKSHHSKFIIAAPIWFGITKYIFYVWKPFGEDEADLSNNLYYAFDSFFHLLVMLIVCTKSDWLMIAFAPMLVFVTVRFFFLIALCFTDHYLKYLSILNGPFLNSILIANLFSLFVVAVFVRRNFKLKIAYMTTEKKDRLLSILRTILTAVGSFIAGKTLLGATVDENLWLGITSALVALASTVWGIFDKTVTQEMVLSTGRSLFLIGGPLLVGTGKVKDETIQALLLAFTTLVPLVMSNSEITKNKNIATGKTPIGELKGVDEKKPELITPTKTK